MSTTISKDGTKIAYEKHGQGNSLILVDGAMCFRSFGPMTHLSELLSPHFTVFTYDRRGRGESSNTLPYSVEREVEDIHALIQEAGGKAYVFGTSSGGCLVLEATLRLGNEIRKMALYEPPYNSEEGAAKPWQDYRQQLNSLVGQGKNGDAVALFMQFVGTPPEAVEGMRQAPMWPMFDAIAPTLEYDAAAMGKDRTVPLKRAADVKVPALVMNGTVIPFMGETATSLAEAMPAGHHKTLTGQSHDVNLEVLAPELVEFFSK